MTLRGSRSRGLRETAEGDVTNLLTLRLPHRAAGGLDDVHLALARRQKRHDINGGNIHAFCQTPGVRHDSATSISKRLHVHFALGGPHLSIDVIGLVVKQMGPYGTRRIASEVFGRCHAAVKGEDLLEVVLFACLLDRNLISDRAGTNYIAFNDHLAPAQEIGIDH